MPPFEVSVDEERCVVLARAHGVIDQALALAMVQEARRVSAQCGHNILYDMRDAKPGDMSSGGLFWMPRQVQALQGAEARKVRVALLHPTQYSAMATYWEDAFGNAGLRVKAFAEDEAAAVEWLTGA